jgi:hypothetical protein
MCTALMHLVMFLGFRGGISLDTVNRMGRASVESRGSKESVQEIDRTACFHQGHKLSCCSVG